MFRVRNYKDAAPTALANLLENRNLSECEALVGEVADELKIKGAVLDNAKNVLSKEA